MDHKQAAKILINLLKKKSLNSEEKEAIQIAIGILSWTLLAENRIKRLEFKRGKV